MPVLRALARPMVASIFIVQGFDTFRNPDKVAPAAEPVVAQLSERLSFVPAKTEQAVRLNGAVQVVAGSLLALGKFPRVSAAVLAATLVPTTAAGHRFWEAEDDASRRQQRIHFLKNCSMFGGLLITAADTAGSPSLAWRSRHAAKTARREASLVAKTAKTSGKAGAKTGAVVGKASARTGAVTGKASTKGGAALGKASTKGGAALGKARTKGGALAGKAGTKTGALAGKASAKTGTAAGKAGAKTGAAAGKARSLVSR
ncbi:MAG: DoxX family membrane protein [Streptosporangiaceae bacterium]